MTNNTFEKTPLASKKFIAFLVAELTWKVLLAIALIVFRTELQAVTGWAWWFMLSVVIVAGFEEALYVGGQAALDKYTRVAALAAQGPKALSEALTENTPSAENTPVVDQKEPQS